MKPIEMAKRFVPRPIRVLANKLLNSRLRILPFPPVYCQDGLASGHNCDFLHDKKFAAAYKAGFETNSSAGVHVHWRSHVACWAASHAMKLHGDFVECGVNRGGLALTTIKYTDFDKSGFN
ncbi:MAG: hypothetical protein E4H01_17155, partial [Lysobacterales bacterium]